MDLNTTLIVRKIKNDMQNLLQNYCFEPNDTITKNNIKNSMTEYLSQIKNRRAIYDYSVICDPSNNPPINYIETLLQNLSADIFENYLIDFDENAYYLFYHDILYRILDKNTGEMITFFEELTVVPVASNELTVDLYIKPIQTVESISISFKIASPR